MVDVYRRAANGYELFRENLDFSTYLGELGYQLIPVSTADQAAYGTNFLTVANRHICAVEGISAEYLGRLKAADITVTLINLDNLKLGYGAAHCTTQVLRRKR
ncbi:MAG: hypothetical protein HC834_04765 [Rhodospirillales bacterium]|nr:hypothetical protein [Rhodospirillales bacterium]